MTRGKLKESSMALSSKRTKCHEELAFLMHLENFIFLRLAPFGEEGGVGKKDERKKKWRC